MIQARLQHFCPWKSSPSFASLQLLPDLPKMRVATLPSSLVTFLCIASTSAGSWNSPQLRNAGAQHLDRRQDSGPTPTATQANPSSFAFTSASTGSNAAQSTASTDTGSSASTPTFASNSGASDPSRANRTTESSGTTSLDPRLPAGGVQLLTPAPISGQQYYKVGDILTFAWNYTSVSVLPTAVDVLATCTQNSALYTLAVNQTVSQGGSNGITSNGMFSNGTGSNSNAESVTWDTGAYAATATVGLPNAIYTLIIYDASKPSSAAASPGFLATYQQHTFGLYNPQAYNNMTGYNCITCSRATPGVEKGFVRGLVAISLAVSCGAMLLLGRL